MLPGGPKMMHYISKDNLDTKTDEWLDGLKPYNTHDFKPDPQKSALLVIDCQNFFISDPEPDGAAILPRINNLIGKFRDVNRPIIFTRHMHKADLSDLGVLDLWWDEHVIENTPESEIHPALDVRPIDTILRKNRYNAFHGTGLDEILRNHFVKDVVITGVMTNICCETTARDAFVRDYRVFFPADTSGTASEGLHFATLMNIAYGFGVIMKSEDVFAE